jgi:E3 ubiquitin-protein ligase NEDD4
MSSETRTVRLTVIAADGLIKKDLFFKMPDPFGKYSLSTGPVVANVPTCICLPHFVLVAVVTVDGEQTHTTTVMKKTLNPYWNESFDL